MDEEVVVTKRNNVLIIVIVAILLIGAGGIIFFLMGGRKKEEPKKEETKKEEKVVEDDEEVSTDWGKKYYDYIKENFAGEKDEIEGYLIDFAYDKVPEVVIHRFDDKNNTQTSILYLKDGHVARSKEYFEGLCLLLFSVDSESIDGWYMYTFDDLANETYYDMTGVFETGKAVTNKTFKIENDEEDADYKLHNIEVPYDFERYKFSDEDFNGKQMNAMIKEYQENPIIDEGTMDFINEILEMKKEEINANE